MSADPYAPPLAALERPGGAAHAVPIEVRALILCGVFASVLCGLFIASGTLRLIGQSVPAVYFVFDVSASLVLWGLAYGTYQGSRTCAALGLVTYVLIRALAFARNGILPSWMSLLLFACFVLGVIGTLRLRRHQARAAGTQG